MPYQRLLRIGLLVCPLFASLSQGKIPQIDRDFKIPERVEQPYALLLTDPFKSAAARFDLSLATRDSSFSSTFILRDDMVGWIHLALIREQARRGVKPIILIDHSQNFASGGSDGLTSSLRKQDVLAALIDSGVHIEEYSVPEPDLIKYFNRLHKKVRKYDGMVVIQSDRNDGKEYFGMTQHAHISRDVIVFSPDLATQVQETVDTMLEAPTFTRMTKESLEGADVGRGHAWLDDALKHIPRRVLEKGKDWHVDKIPIEKAVYFSDDPLRKTGVPGTAEYIIDFIDGAEDYLIIENPYVILTPGLEGALERARLRGVRVIFMTNSRQAQEHSIVWAAWLRSRKFLARIGAEVWEHRGFSLSRLMFRLKHLIREYFNSHPSLHSKAMVRKRAGKLEGLMASFNFDYISVYKNLESGVHIFSDEFGQKLNDAMLADLNSGLYVKVAEHGKILPAAKALDNCEGKLMGELVARATEYFWKPLAELLREHL